MSKVLCIYPDDKTTKFLNKIQASMKATLGKDFHCFKVKSNDQSHKMCMSKIMDVHETGSILFMGHGRSDCLFGAAANLSNAFVSNDFLSENPDITHSFEHFITRDNISVFKNQKVFCLTCNSALGFGQLAIEAGAKVFLGFGDIPTEYHEALNVKDFSSDWKAPMPKRVTNIFKGEITGIVKSSLLLVLKNQMCYDELGNTIKLITNRRINDIIRYHAGIGRRRLLCDYLFQFKEEIKVFGDASLQF